MLSCYCRLPRSEALPTEWVGTPDLAEVISGIIAPRRVRRGVSAELSAERGGRAIITSQVINGKWVQVQRRRPFAIHVG